VSEIARRNSDEIPSGQRPRLRPAAPPDPRLADVEALARWLDYAFVLPGGFRFGFDGIIGLIPGVGDLLDALISLYIVYRAFQLGLPKVTIARMVLNIGIDGVIGAVPLLGDVFDFVFKANLRNYELMRDHMAEPRRQHRLDWLFVLAIVLLLLAAVALPLVALGLLVRRLGA
jgi:hypothetical protein